MANRQTEIQYYIRAIDDTTGRVAGIWDDFIQVSAKTIHNRGGMIVAVVPDGHPILDYATFDRLFQMCIVIPYRLKSDTTYSARHFLFMNALFRDSQATTDEFGNLFYMLYMMHPLEVLDRYVSAYPTGVANKTDWVGQEQGIIANDILIANCTGDATVANGRIRDASIVRGFEDLGAITGTAVVDFAIEPGTPIIDTLRDLARTAPFNFSVGVSDTFTPGGLVSVQSAITGGGTLGDDVSADIHFDVNLDNVKRASISGDRLSERTVAIVGGGGEASSRVFEVRTGENYSTPDNDKEMWVNARTNTDDELPTVGDLALARAQARNKFTTDLTSSLGWIPLRDFIVGDLVTTHIGELSVIQRVTTMEFVFDQTQIPQSIVEFEDFIEGA